MPGTATGAFEREGTPVALSCLGGLSGVPDLRPDFGTRTGSFQVDVVRPGIDADSDGEVGFDLTTGMSSGDGLRLEKGDVPGGAIAAAKVDGTLNGANAAFPALSEAAGGGIAGSRVAVGSSGGG